MNHQQYVRGKQQELVDTALRIVEGRIDPVQGCRLICALQNEIRLETDDAFDVIKAIESETDTSPLGQSREHCNPKHLSKVDEETYAYMDRVQAQLKEACLKIIGRLAPK